MSNDWRGDLLNVPADDSAAAYGAGSHGVSVDKLGAGKASAADDHPSEAFDAGDLEFLPGQEFTRADGSKSR
jgi:hypothetical protein